MAKQLENDCDILVKMIKSNSINFDMGYLNNKPLKSLVNYANNFPDISLKDLQLFGIDNKKNISTLDEEYLSTYKGLTLVGLFRYKNHTVIKIPPLKVAKVKIGKQYDYYIVPDPNKKFYLIDDTPLVTDETIEIHNLLYEWSRGSSFEVGDKILTKLLKYNIQNEFKKCSKTLYRGFMFSPIALQKLQEGKSVRLQKRIFSSWSETKEQALEFADDVVLQYQPKNEVVINPNEFEREVFNSTLFYPNSKENEVILLNSPEMLLVHPHQVVEGIESLKHSKKKSRKKFIPTVNLDSRYV